MVSFFYNTTGRVIVYSCTINFNTKNNITDFLLYLQSQFDFYTDEDN